MQGRELDRDALHRELWDLARKDRQHLVEVYQTGLAEELHVNNSTMSAAMRDLVQSGRIKKIRALRGNIGIYLIREPAPLP